MARIIAIDYGTNRVGLAVTDPLQLIATPLQTVATDQVMAFLIQYAQREPIEAFVVGWPKRLNNEEAPMTQKTHGFMQRLAQQFPQQALFKQDERYTSKLAAEALWAAGYSKKIRRKKDNLDKVSATLILQTFLEKKRRL